MMAIPLIIIAGPTGAGKTEVAVEIAERTEGEIVGADSMQVYRYMDIGTAKPTVQERARTPHHLIDIRNPDENYSAADYARDAAAAIRDIHSRAKMPLLVGGTGLYIQAVLQGIFEGPGRDEAFRTKMRGLAKERGNIAVHQELRRVDPQTAKRLHPNDLLRIIRALEVFHLTGTSISDQQAVATAPIDHYNSCFLVLTTTRKQLYAKINARVEQMMAAGLVDEVKDLLRRGYHAELNPMKSLGYNEIGEYLAGKYDLPAAMTLIKRNTRHYAKRQLTWFRKSDTTTWISYEASDSFEEIIRKCLQIISKHYG